MRTAITCHDAVADEPQSSGHPSDVDPACRLFRRCLADRRAADWELFLQRFGASFRRAVRRAWVRRAPARKGAGLSFEEILQEVYCRLLDDRQAPFEGRSGEQLWAWVERVAGHLMCDLWRRRRARKRQQPTPESVSLHWYGAEIERQARANPEHRLLVNEAMEVLLRRCRDVVREVSGETVASLLRRAFLEGCTSREIAHSSDGRMTTRDVNRLLNLLRRRLAARGLYLPRRRNAGRQAPWRATAGAPC